MNIRWISRRIRLPRLTLIYISLLIVSSLLFLAHFWRLQYTQKVPSNQLKSLLHSSHGTRPRVSTVDNGNLSVIKEMTRMAWKSYMDLCALKTGGNELAPLTKSCSQVSDGLVGPNNLLTVIDALDTLILMNLNEEFQQGRDLIKRMFKPLATSNPVSVFETTIRILGGLLGAFSLTEDPLFARLATQVGKGLADAFNDGSFSNTAQLNYASLFTKRLPKSPRNPINTNIAEVGSLYLEFAYLSEVSGDPKFHYWVDRIQSALLNMNKNKDGLIPNQVTSKSAWKLEAVGGTYSVGGMGDSYYEYLVKRCIFDRPSKSDNCFRIFSRSLDGIMKHLALVTTKNNVLITRINDEGIKENSMEHLACFAGGMFALAYLENKTRTDWLEFAKKVTETCYLSYFSHPIGLGSEVFYFDAETKRLTGSNTVYILRPETVESIYYLYMATGNEMYRDWGWNIVKALNSTAVRTASGFSGIKHMNGAVPVLDNVQYSFFLAETVKYLYLLFLPPNSLPLDQWLFNTEAHVIPSWRNPLRQKLRSASRNKL